MGALSSPCFAAVACASTAPAIAADWTPVDIEFFGIQSVSCASGNAVVHTDSA